MKNLRLKIWFISIMIIFMIPFFITNPTAPVIAAEEDEEDNFTSMPNYRWLNESITDSNVNEQLIGSDTYQIENSNNETSGTQKIEKSRALNSRDLYFETRFNIDIAGNQTEYFRDVKGDICDFNEGDEEEILSGYVNSHGVENGYLYGNGDGSHTYMYFYARSEEHPTIELSRDLLKDIRVKMSATFDFRLTFYWSHGDDFWAYQRSQTQYNFEPNTWHEISFGAVPISYTTGVVNFFRFNIQPTAGGNIPITDFFYVDWFEIISDFDYATHIEDEIEDTWDWEDSKEYFTDEESNISDFNDGSEELWLDYGGDTVSNENGWLRITDNGDAFLNTRATGLTIDSTEYAWFTMEFQGSASITGIKIFDSGSNEIATDSLGWSANTKYLFSHDLDLDADWTGTETELRIWVATAGNFEMNFTFIYNIEKGDLEDWTQWSTHIDYAQTNPNGYISYHVKTNTDPYVSNTAGYTSNIDGSFFDIFKMRFRYEDFDDICNLVLFYWDTDAVLLSGGSGQELYAGSSGDWTEFETDLSTFPGWKDNIIGKIRIDIENCNHDTYLHIDHMLLLGEFDDTEGFKYSLLNREHEEGVSFEFIRNNDESNSYNFTVDMMDNIGIALHYTEQFNYSLSDGWLELSVSLNLNKKKIKITLEYENGTDIIYLRSLYELYGSIGTPNLKILDVGYPRLCINGSTDAMSRITVQINYIDANWVIINWEQPDGNCPVSDAYDQSMTSSKTLSPYGFVLDQEIIGYEHAWFMLNIDRFDGFSAELTIFRDGLDAGTTLGDHVTATILIANIKTDGSLDLMAKHHIFSGLITPDDDTSYRTYIYEEDGTPIDLGERTVAGEEAKSKVSFYLDQQRNELIVQTVSDSGATALKTSGNVSRSTTITSEMVIFVIYSVYGATSSGSDDYITVELAGVDIVRKDLLGDIVGAILSPLVEGLTFLVSLILIPFMWVLSGMVKVGQAIIEGLTPIITGISDVLGGLINSATGVISGLITGLQTVLDAAIGAVKTAVEGVTTALGSLAEGIWSQLLTLTSSIADFIEDVLVLVIPFLTDLLNQYFTWLLGFYEDILNNLLFTIFDEIIAALGLTDLITFMLTFFTDLLVILGDIIILITVIMGFFFESAIFWFEPGNFGAAVLVISLVVGVWLFYPLYILFLAIADGTMDLDLLIDTFEQMFNKIGTLIGLAWTFISYVFEFMLSLLTTIGGFIPLT